MVKRTDSKGLFRIAEEDEEEFLNESMTNIKANVAEYIKTVASEPVEFIDYQHATLLDLNNKTFKFHHVFKSKQRTTLEEYNNKLENVDNVMLFLKDHVMGSRYKLYYKTENVIKQYTLENIVLHCLLGDVTYHFVRKLAHK